MEIVPYKQLLKQWADVCGIESDSIPDLDQERFNNAFNRVIRRGWTWHRWPTLQLLEERRYRPIWMDGEYAIDDEVYHEATDTYYRANDDTTAGQEPGASTKWTALDDEDVDAYVAYEQDGETGFSLVTDVFAENPRFNLRARRLKWEYDDRGVRIIDTNVPETCWVCLHQRCPRWKGETWDAESAYSAGAVVYFESDTQDFEGDFWLVLDDTTAGQSPITEPTKFARQEIPEFLGEFAVQGAQVAYLKGEQQLDKALAQDGNALWDLLAEERNRLLGGRAAPRRARVANI